MTNLAIWCSGTVVRLKQATLCYTSDFKPLALVGIGKLRSMVQVDVAIVEPLQDQIVGRTSFR